MSGDELSWTDLLGESVENSYMVFEWAMQKADKASVKLTKAEKHLFRVKYISLLDSRCKLLQDEA